MNGNCEVIRDLIPLCVDELASSQSQKMVQEHISTCESCREYFAEIQQPVSVSMETDIDSFKQLRSGMYKRVLLAVFSSVFLMVTILLGIGVYNVVPVALHANEAIVRVKENGDGRIRITFSEQVDGINFDTGLFCYGLRSKWIQNTFFAYNNPKLDSGASDLVMEEENLWYIGKFSGEENSLLWGDPATENLIAPSVDASIMYVFIVGITGGVVLLLLGFLLRKKRFSKWFWYIGSLCLCSAAACLFVTDGHLLVHDTGIYSFQFMLENPAVFFHPGNHWGCRILGIFGMTLFSWASVVCSVKFIKLFYLPK